MFRDPRMKPLVFVSPIVQLLLFGYAVNTDIHDTGLFVVDHDRSAESARLIEGFTSTGYFGCNLKFSFQPFIFSNKIWEIFFDIFKFSKFFSFGL